MIAFPKHPYWWSPSSTDITSGSVEVVLRLNGAMQDVPTSLPSPISLSLPNSAKQTETTTTGTIYPGGVAMFFVNVSNPEGTIFVAVLTVDGKDTPNGNMAFRLCEGKVADIECAEIKDCKPCCDLWTFKFG